MDAVERERAPFGTINLDEEAHQKLLQSMEKGMSYIKKTGIRLRKEEAVAQKVKQHRREIASRQKNRAQQEFDTPMDSITDDTFTDLEPPSLQVMFPSSGSCQAPEGSAISMVSLLDALEKTSLKDILFNTDKEDWDAESLLEDLIESGGLVDFIECGNEDVVNRDVVNALFDVLINCMDQGIVYGSYRSLAFVLSYQDKEWVPDIKGFVEYLKRIGYRREGPVVDWEEMESKESGMGCLQCPITTGRVQLYLRLLSVATESNPVKFSSCHHVQCIVELFCMLVHLFLDVSGESYETDLIQALSGLVSVIGTKEFENMIGVIVDELTELGPTHRSQVHLLRANWSQQLEVQALQRLWGLNALKKILPKEVPLYIKHGYLTHKDCLKHVLDILNSPDALLDSLQTDYKMKGGKLTTVDWWLVDSIMHTLEGLLALCVIEGTDNFTGEERTQAGMVWCKFLSQLMKYARNNSALNSVGYSNLKHHLRVFQVRWDEHSRCGYTQIVQDSGGSLIRDVSEQKTPDVSMN